MVLGLPHVGDHAQGDGSAGGREAAERAEGEDGAEVRGQGAGDLPEVDEAEGDLQDPAATEFLDENRSVTSSRSYRRRWQGATLSCMPSTADL